MSRFFTAALLCVAAFPAAAQEIERAIVTIPTRPGVTQSFFVAGMGNVTPQAVALIYTGGYGTLNLRMEGGQPKFGQNNFLVRTRADFIRNGVLPVLVEVPSDERTGVPDLYRFGDKQVADTRAVLAEVRKRAPGLPIFIATTSRSTLSGAHLARSLGPDEVAGVVLSSSLIVPGGQGGYSLGTFNFKSIKLPLLIVHHRGDTCRATPYGPMARAAKGFTLISVKGGKAPESDPCEPFAAHGFYGKEAETVDAITAWMLKKPFATEIE
jgi:hypothetical protein